MMLPSIRELTRCKARHAVRIVPPMLLSLLLYAPALAAEPAEVVKQGLLKVSENKRFLVHQDGTPFFYLGDTAWELFHRLNREEADKYLANRAAKGFTVIQAVAIAEVDGHSGANAYGHLPLIDLDPARPAVQEGPANDYWDHVDYIVDKANSLGLYIGFLPTWGRYWHDKVKDGQPLFTPQNAEVYGEWLGRRYKDKALIWILGGDRPIDNDTQKRSHPRDGSRPAPGRRRRASDDISSAGRQRLLHLASTRTTGSISTCVRTATRSNTPADTTARGRITTACRSSR